MQFDLFDERRGPALIIAFPLSRRRELVLRTAGELASLDYEKGRRHWQRHVRQMKADLRKNGLGSSAIETEMQAYSAAVSRHVIILEEKKA